jgi:hypothetical protein
VYYIDYNEQCNNLIVKQPLVSLLPGNNSLVPGEQPPSTTMDTSPCQESSISWTKATSKRGRYPREEPTREAKYQLERMNPTTDDEQENDITENTNMVDWQLVRGIKRRKSNKVFQNNNPSQPAVPTSNRYELLTNEVTNKEEQADVNTTKRIPRPPTISVYDVINYPRWYNTYLR